MIKEIKEKWWFRWTLNKYMLTGVLFAVWMLFFDDNSWLINRELKQEIENLEASISFYESELNRDREALRELESDPDAFEKYAREKFWMHRDGEEIYIIELEE